jgi:hypothetical protein
MLKIILLFVLLLSRSTMAQIDVMVCDSLGNNLPQAAPGTTINLDVKVYVDIFWSARDGFMKNELIQYTPKKPKDLFGFSNLVQTKWWPMMSDYELNNIPGDFISWVYVEMRTSDYNISYSLPGYLDRNGYIKDINGNMFSITVAPHRDYFLIVHSFNGNSVVAANNGTSLKTFSVTTANTINWNFTDGWRKALIHITQTSYPMIELPSLNGTTVWAIPSGDVPEPEIASGDRISSWDNFVDFSDLRSIELNFGVKAGFSPFDLNLDKHVDVQDWLYVNDNTMFFISGNPFVYKLRRH